MKISNTRSSALAAVFVAASLAGAPQALAQGKGKGAAKKEDKNFKKGTKQEAEIQAQQTALTRPEAPPKAKGPGGPTMTAEQFVERKQAEVSKIVDAQIEKMQKLVKITPNDDPQKPDFLFRLGEYYGEKMRFYDFRAEALEQKIFEAPAAMKNQLKNEQAGYRKQKEKYQLEAAKQYIASNKYRKYQRRDEVLFRLASLLMQAKREEQARQYFHELIKDYPNSKYIPDAYLSFAEFFFDKQEMDNALKFYEKVEQFPKSSVYPYAVYKKGWCYINLGDYKAALEIFVAVATKIAPASKAGESQKKALAKEAKKDIVKAYAHVGGPDKAWEFFQRTGGDFAPKMLEGLAELYWEQGKFPESSQTYRKIISMNMDDPKICGWQFKIVRNTLSAGTKRDQVQEIERLGAVHDKVQSMKGAKKEEIEECRNNFHDTTKELALIWHKEAQKTKNPDTYALAKYLYKEYIDHFPNEKSSYDMNFYYGELLFVLENWKEAAEQYTKVVEMKPDGKYTKEAAYAAVISWKNALRIDDEGLNTEAEQAGTAFDKAKNLGEKPIPAYQQKMIEAFDTYIKYVPDAPELLNIKYRKAMIFYEYNHFDEAAKLFADIIEKYKSSELAIYSANLLLDSLNALKRTKDVIRWVDRFLEMPELMKDERFRKDMVSLKSDTYYIEGKDFEAQKNYKECGRSMEASAETYPEHPQHASRLYDAGLCYQNAHLIGQALRVRTQLIKLYPKDKLSQRALFMVASGYHQLASYTKAAENYEDFANKFPGEKKAVDALGNAYKFRIGLGENDKAVEDMRSFIKFYGQRKPQDAAAVFFQMGEVYEQDKNWDALEKHMGDYLKKWGPHGGIDKKILATFKIGEIEWRKSCPQDGVNGACIKLERVKASGRLLALQRINSRIKDKKKRIKITKTQCGPPTKSKITVFDRSKTSFKKAQDSFKEVLKLWAKGAAASKVPGKDAGEQQARIALAQYAVAGAAFYLAETEYENFLRIKFPEGLDFSQASPYDSKKKQEAQKKKAEESAKKFTGYMDEKSKLAIKLVGDAKANKGLFGEVLDFKVAHWTIASGARIGQVWQNFADQLYTAEIPKDLKEMDEWGVPQRQIFCDTLEDKAEPIEAKAVEGFELCLRGATEQSWFNEWSRLCEKELNQMQPSDYPLASEAKPEAGYVSTTMSAAPLVSDLPGTGEASEAKTDDKGSEQGGQP